MTDSNRTEPEGFEPFAARRACARHADERSDAAAGWERATLEKLAFATLQEQRTARRWRTFMRLAWLAFFVFLVWTLAVARHAQRPTRPLPHTAVIEIKGEIASAAMPAPNSSSRR